MNDEVAARDAVRPRTGLVTPLGGNTPPVNIGDRDLALERSLTRQAAETGGVDADALIEFAEARAGGGKPIRGLPARNLLREAFEELADARNYIVWRAGLAYSEPDPDGELIADLNAALQYVCIAFHYLRRAQASAVGA